MANAGQKDAPANRGIEYISQRTLSAALVFFFRLNRLLLRGGFGAEVRTALGGIGALLSGAGLLLGNGGLSLRLSGLRFGLVGGRLGLRLGLGLRVEIG